MSPPPPDHFPKTGLNESWRTTNGETLFPSLSAAVELLTVSRLHLKPKLYLRNAFIIIQCGGPLQKKTSECKRDGSQERKGMKKDFLDAGVCFHLNNMRIVNWSVVCRALCRKIYHHCSALVSRDYEHQLAGWELDTSLLWRWSCMMLPLLRQDFSHANDRELFFHGPYTDLHFLS